MNDEHERQDEQDEAGDLDEAMDLDTLMREAPLENLLLLISLGKGSEAAVRPWRAFRAPRVPNPTWRDAEPLVRMIREWTDRGQFSRNEAHYMVARIVELLIDTRTAEDPDFVRDEARRAQILEEYGIAHQGDWDRTEQPVEYRRLFELWGARMMRTSADWLDELGEREMARLMRVDPEEYVKRQEEGWSAFYGIELTKGTVWDSPSVGRPVIDDRRIQ